MVKTVVRHGVRKWWVLAKQVTYCGEWLMVCNKCKSPIVQVLMELSQPKSQR